MWSDHPSRPQVAEHPGARVRLVSEPDLHVLDVAGHACVGKSNVGCGEARDLHCVAERLHAACTKASLHGVEELGDARLRRISPRGLGNQVDLATVEPLRHDRRRQSLVGESLNSQLGRGGDRGVLFVGCGAPVEQPGTRPVDGEHLRSAVQTEEQLPGAGGPRCKLTVDVANMRPADDGEVHPQRAQLLNERPHRPGVRLPVGDCGSIPVEDDRLEPPGDRSRKRGCAPDGAAHTAWSGASRHQTADGRAAPGLTPPPSVPCGNRRSHQDCASASAGTSQDLGVAVWAACSAAMPRRGDSLRSTGATVSVGCSEVTALGGTITTGVRA